MLLKPDFEAYSLIEKCKKAFAIFMRPDIEFANEQLQMMRFRLYRLRTASISKLVRYFAMFECGQGHEINQLIKSRQIHIQ